MANYNFEGSLENISNEQFEFINKVILAQGIKVKKSIFQPVGKAGDNFAANVKRIVVQGEDESLQFIVKIAPQNDAVRQLVMTTLAFMNEHIMYTEFFPKVEQMQIEAGVPIEDRLRYAKCYGSLSEYLHEIIILEDLSLSEFKMLNKFESLTDDCVRSVLKNIAILHSLSYALKYKEPKTFEDLKNKLVDVFSLMAKQVVVHMEQVIEGNILAVLEEESLKNKVKSKLENMVPEMESLLKFEYNNKNSVILQSDAWTNNFMFRFKGDQLLESIMIDYQLSKNGNPVYDIMFMIFNCTDYETRSKNYFEWIDYYYTQLDKSLSYFNFEASSVYPRNEMDSDMKRYAGYLFSHTCFTTILLMRSSGESEEMVDSMQASSDFSGLLDSLKTDKLEDESLIKIRKRITGLIKTFEECDMF